MGESAPREYRTEHLRRTAYQGIFSLEPWHRGACVIVQTAHRLRNGEVTTIARAGQCFIARCGDDRIEARTVLFATGVVDVEPDLRSDDPAALRRHID